MTTILFSHEACSNHRPGDLHPERPARMEAVAKALSAAEFDRLDRREAPLATVDQIARMHPRPFVESVLEAVPEDGIVAIDGDTLMSPGSGEAALRASGAAVAAVDAVLAREAKNAFCAVRPPGHHAEHQRPMGFCFFNSVAVAAEHARKQHGLERVAVVDFDVHHGNGTQDLFEADKDLFFGSTHQMPLFPGTGGRDETGVGNIFNAPLRAGDDGEVLLLALQERIIPALENFSPDLLIISAGFDAHMRDPLAQMNVETDDFGRVTNLLLSAADRLCDGRVVSCLEGGYDLVGLSESVTLHVRELMSVES